MKYIFSVLFTVFIVFNANSQANIGFVSGGDLYQRYVNPDDNSGINRSSGSFLLNGNTGLKFYVGTPKVSLSVESYFNVGSLALNLNDYQGLGAASIPVLAKINFNGLSGLRKVDESRGWSIGGGVQWSRTEWYFISRRAREDGIQRSFFRNYVVEVSFGKGNRSKVQEWFVRVGLDPNVRSSTFNFGLNTTYSFPYMKLPKFNLKPESEEEEEVIKI